VLTYCTNIHPGESWEDVKRNLTGHFLDVKAAVAPGELFPIGLRLSARAASEIDDAEAKRFLDWCRAHDCFVLSVNGFPFGDFHATRVKEAVYLPDWRDPERVAYTKRLADLLALWLQPGDRASISTVPIAFKKGFSNDDWPRVRSNLIEVSEHLEEIRQLRELEIGLAFEPEPCCVLETTSEAVDFFSRMALPEARADLVGLCFDCCHQAVEFEEPSVSLSLLEEAHVRIFKVQVSSALRARPDELDAIAGFAEPTYLHQVVTRWRDGSLSRYSDLPEFLADLSQERRAELVECRVHFHVPIFAKRLGHCGTTQFFLEDILPRLAPEIPLEVETYSWGVLPGELRGATVSMDIIRELEWVRARVPEGRNRPVEEV
jgi:sugar phosphate isomerase/epimerase